MKSIFYILIFLIIDYWALGAFVWNLGPIVHSLLLVAVIALFAGNKYKDELYG